MMPMNEEQARLDEAARLEATAPGGSILLEAPAGSGKTAVLTQRFLRLLATVDDPDEILAITFTRKAAAEMRARVIRALRLELPAQDPGAQALRPLAAAALAHGARRGWQLAAEPERLRIQTIDSFNYWLASQLPVAARTGGALEVSEHPGELYGQAARRALSGAESDAELAAHAQRLFERLDNHWPNLERLIAQMLAERGHWLHFVFREDPAALCRRVDDSLAALAAERLAALTALIPEGLRRRAKSLPGSAPLGSSPAALLPWKHFAHLVLTRNDWRRQLSAHRLRPGFTEACARERLRSDRRAARHRGRTRGAARAAARPRRRLERRRARSDRGALADSVARGGGAAHRVRGIRAGRLHVRDRGGARGAQRRRRADRARLARGPQAAPHPGG